MNKKSINKTDDFERILRIPRERRTFSEKASDWLTSFVGSWAFMFLLLVYISIWIMLNLVAWFYHWDPWPFILLNLSLSCLAALQAPIILMSQNRSADRDRRRAERDYYVDKRSMREVEDMQKDLDEIKKMIRNLNRKIVIVNNKKK